jgi:hypothetical protein
LVNSSILQNESWNPDLHQYFCLPGLESSLPGRRFLKQTKYIEGNCWSAGKMREFQQQEMKSKVGNQRLP